MANAVKLLWLLKCPVQNIKIPKVNLSCCCLKCLLCKQVVQIDFLLRGGTKMEEDGGPSLETEQSCLNEADLC